MSLSRKHFIALAKIVRELREHATLNVHGTDHTRGMLAACDIVADDLARFCAPHNPSFDRARFLAACEPKE